MSRLLSIEMESFRRASERSNIAGGTASPAFIKLQERGFIECMTKRIQPEDTARQRMAAHMVELRCLGWRELSNRSPTRPPLSIGIASGSSILIGRNLVGGVQPDVSQPISPPALAPPPVQSRVCPGYRIERTELRAAGGADSGFARIKLSSHSRISIVD